jgi:hypothetical protein
MTSRSLILTTDKLISSWATPYACSVYGNDVENCPFGGNGYGDGRAISLVELLLPSGNRWELQLKGVFFMEDLYSFFSFLCFNAYYCYYYYYFNEPLPHLN